MYLFYNVLLRIFSILINIAGIFNDKAEQWTTGRKTQIVPNLNDKKVIWMHCSSLGEFEQGRPVFEKLRDHYVNHTFVLTFFSPSGLNKMKNHDKADYVLYLPLDLPKKAQQFITKINPELSVFVKYDFWYNYLNILNKENRKTVYISVILSESHYLFKFFGKFMLRQLEEIKMIFTQDRQTYKLLKSKGFKNIETAGDTRIDRVIEIANTKYNNEIVERFCGDKKIFICGSTWQKDINLLSEVDESFWRDYKMIIAPHEPSENQINHIQKKFYGKNIVKYSDKQSDFASAEILIIDTIGILSRLYRYARLAYIGGGFSDSIHSTLEPSAYHIPVMFGPRYKGFYEAETLVNEKAFFVVRNKIELNEKLLFLDNDKEYKNVASKIVAFYDSNKDASQKIINFIRTL